MNLSALQDLGLGLGPSVLLPLLLLGLGTVAAGARICRRGPARPAGIVLAATGVLLVAGVVLEAVGQPSAWTVTVATRITGPIAVLLYPRILPRDWLHWALVALCAIAGSVAVVASQQTLVVTVAMVVVASTVAWHLWWRRGRAGADRSALSWLSMGVVGAVVAYAILTIVPSPVLPAASQALAAACVPLAMVLGVRRPDPRGGAAVATSLAVIVVAAFVAAVAYIVIISLVTRATGRPTLIVEEAVVILLCAACLDLVRRLLQGKVDQRLFGSHTGLPDDGRFTMPGDGAGVVIRMAADDDTRRSSRTVHEGLGRRLAGIARSTDTLSDLIDDEHGLEAAAARQLVAVVQMETAAALEEIRRLSPAGPP